jgi:hypothetical protein
VGCVMGWRFSFLLLFGMSVLAASGETPEKQADDALQSLAPEVRAKLHDLGCRLEAQWHMPASPNFKRINIADELKAICSTSDLTIVIRSKSHSLWQPSRTLLMEVSSSSLTPEDIAALRDALGLRDVRARHVADVLFAHQDRCLAVLQEALRGDDVQMSVNAAGALRNSTDSALAKEAKLVLLEALARPESVPNAFRGVQPLDPWMRQWLASRCLNAQPSSPIWSKLSLLVYSKDERDPELLRKTFLRGAEHPDEGIRSSAIQGLARLGVRGDDRAIYEATSKVPGTAQASFYALRDADFPWAIDLLIAGIAHSDKNVVARHAECLGERKIRRAVPALMRVFEGAPREAKPYFGQDYRAIGAAVAKLAGKDFDFAAQMHCVQTSAMMRAQISVPRDELYAQEAKRLRLWWHDEGSNLTW